MVCHGVKDPSILVYYAMKSQTIKIIYLVLMIAFSSLILASCAVVEKIDSLNGILEEPAADYEVRELKKGEEAFFNEKPCIIAREETEWLELVDNGFAQLVGSDDKKMFKSFEYFYDSKLEYSKNLYGNQVGQIIYEYIFNLL